MASTSPEPTKLECTIIEPRNPKNHTHTIIFLHGRGDNAKDFSRALKFLTSSNDLTFMEHFPTTKWIFPSSEMRPSARYTTLNGGKGFDTSQWFDTWDVGNLSYREDLQMPGLAESVASILALAEEEVATNLGGRWDRLVLMGISQGGAVVMHTLLNLKLPREVERKRLGGVVGFSCRFPFPRRSLDETRKIVGLWKEETEGDDGDLEEGGGEALIENTPVLIEHCLDDPLVKVDTGRQVRDVMTGFGATVTWKEYPVKMHWIRSPEGVDDAIAWLEENVFARPRGGN